MSEPADTPRPARGESRPGGSRKSRRSFLRTMLLGGGVVLTALSGMLPLSYARTRRLRPPGALDESDFLSSCIKCGQCLQVCPVSAIRLGDLVDGYGVGVPLIDARQQACDFSCDAAQCILACPTGALSYEKPAFLPVRDGAQLSRKPVLRAKEHDPENTLNFRERMGVARLARPESCLAAQGRSFNGTARGPEFDGKLRYMDVDRWKPVPVREHPYAATPCDLCITSCPIVGAISLESFVDEGGVTRVRPAVHEACVGCGVCEMICPAEPGCIKIDAREVWKT